MCCRGQYWNRLHRLQKNVILLAVLLVVTFFLVRYQFDSLGESSRPRDHNKEPSKQDTVNEKPVPNGDRALLLEKVCIVLVLKWIGIELIEKWVWGFSC